VTAGAETRRRLTSTLSIFTPAFAVCFSVLEKDATLMVRSLSACTAEMFFVASPRMQRP